MGRPEDREDLKKIAGGKTAEIQNSNFRTFLECVEKFKDEKFKERKEDWDNFAGYVYENASFLVSELPAKYTPTDLNLFFEKMNSTGRQLTPVEQIKGKYFPALAAPFDDCLNFEKPFAKENSNTEESGQASSCLLDILKDNDTPVTTESNNQKSDETAGVKSILSPEVFLLHCLGIAKKSQDKELQSSTIVIPHDERKILDTFNKYVGENKEIKPNVLLEIMQEYRKWLDDNIIYLEASSDGSWEYRSRQEDTEQGNKQNEDPQDKDQKSLKQFQSMLYVSSSNYQQWVLDAYWSPTNGKITLDLLKEQDNARHPYPKSESEMTYLSVDRYWFWKLDYLLWENFTTNNKKFSFNNNEAINKLTPEETEAILNYKFRHNRSIEHLHPQTDGDKSEWKDAKHQFGNLAMISSSFNSLQQNDSVGVKFARLQETQIPNKSLESIKLLLMFKLADGKEDGWTTGIAEAHGKAMYEFLRAKPAEMTQAK